MNRPDYTRYVQGWGRDGDCGFVAHSSRFDRQAIRAVWLRSTTADQIPELAFAVSRSIARQASLSLATAK